MNVAPVVESPIYPEYVLDCDNVSRLEVTLMKPPAVDAAPIVKPFKVTTTAKGIEPDSNVTLILESVLGPEMAVAVPLKETLVGVTPEAKNPDGYINVIVLEADSAPPALGVKPNVTGTPGLLTTRSLFAMLNATLVTAPPIQPEAVLSEETSS